MLTGTQAHKNMVVREEYFSRIFHHKLPGHAEMHQPDSAIIEMKMEILSPTGDPKDCPSSQCLRKVSSHRSA
jgi:hypothetical protein